MVLDSVKHSYDGPNRHGIQTSLQNQAKSLMIQFIIKFDLYHVYKTALTCGMSISMSLGYPFY
jgi:hypothetical protein